jgi:ABC-type uncharacterized transport system substrate-binding protein
MRCFLAIALALPALPAPLAAHPHGWIDIQTEVLVDDAGRLEGLRQAWLFDEFYSAFMLDDFAQAGLDREQGLARLLRQDVEALAPHDYFTRVEIDGEPQPFGAARAYANGVAAGRIWFRFELPLAEPVDPSDREVRYAVFDPTYYIELLHHGDAPVRLAAGLAERCAVEVIEPDPPAEIVSLAALLDRSAEADDGLGAHFAQWVELRCAPPR